MPIAKNRYKISLFIDNKSRKVEANSVQCNLTDLEDSQRDKKAQGQLN